MIVVALVLLIIVLVVSMAIVSSNPDVYQLSLFRVLVPVTSAGVFFTGFGAALVTITALLLLRTGIRRSRETRRRLRDAERSTASAAGASGSGADRSDAGRSDAGRIDGPQAIGRTDPLTASSSHLDPGEDRTTVPVDRQAGGRRTDDRDEPRT